MIGNTASSEQRRSALVGVEPAAIHVANAGLPSIQTTKAQAEHCRDLLRDQVVALCSFDRRALAKSSNDQTRAHLVSELQKSEIKVDYFPENQIPCFKPDEIKNFIERASQANSGKPQLFENLNSIGGHVITNLRARLGDPNGKKIILGAHFDTAITVPSGAGADDNASGVSVLLELARQLKPYEQILKDNGYCIDFAFFDAEEAPFSLFGSRAYVDQLEMRGELAKVQLMINLDMVGYFDEKQKLNHGISAEFSAEYPSVQKLVKRLEAYMPMQEDYYIIDTNDRTESHRLVKTIERELGDFSLEVRNLGPSILRYEIKNRDYTRNYSGGQSDHYSFREKLPAVGVICNPRRNPNYHKDSDCPDSLNYGKMNLLTSSLLSFLLQLVRNNDPEFVEKF